MQQGLVNNIPGQHEIFGTKCLCSVTDVEQTVNAIGQASDHVDYKTMRGAVCFLWFVSLVCIVKVKNLCVAYSDRMLLVAPLLSWYWAIGHQIVIVTPDQFQHIRNSLPSHQFVIQKSKETVVPDGHYGVVQDGLDPNLFIKFKKRPDIFILNVIPGSDESQWIPPDIIRPDIKMMLDRATYVPLSYHIETDDVHGDSGLALSASPISGVNLEKLERNVIDRKKRESIIDLS